MTGSYAPNRRDLNIRTCVGGDGRFDPERTVKVLKEIDAEVVALQEVQHHSVGGSDLFDYMATAVALSAIVLAVCVAWDTA